jgi:hypothetical protein
MPTTPRTKRPWPTTVEEAVDRLLERMPKADKEELRAMPEEELILLHFGMAMSVRNRFGLWAGNEALLADCAATNARKNGMELSWVWIDPDDASMVIIEALWRRLQEQPKQSPKQSRRHLEELDAVKE